MVEIGDKGARHHHLVINQIDTKILQQCWYKAYEGHNRVKVFPLDDSGNYADLAAYLIKYTDKHRKEEDGALQGKRWNSSKNLVRPVPEIRIISDRQWFKAEPRAIKGYYVDKDSPAPLSVVYAVPVFPVPHILAGMCYSHCCQDYGKIYVESEAGIYEKL